MPEDPANTPQPEAKPQPIQPDSDPDAEFNAPMDESNVVMGNEGSITQFAGHTEIHVHSLPPIIRRWGWIIVVVMLGLLGLIAIQQRSATATKAPDWDRTGQSSAVTILQTTPPPQPTQTPIPALGLTWPLQFSETFDTNANRWELVQETSEWGVSNVRLTSDHAYQLGLSDSPEGFLLRVTAPLTLSTSRFYAAADVQKVRGPAESACGLAMVDNNNATYFFRMEQATGIFSVQYLNPRDSWSTIIEPRESEQIKLDEAHRMAIQADGPTMTFWIDGIRVGSYNLSDDGEAVSFVWLDLSAELLISDEMACRFDNVEIRWP